MSSTTVIDMPNQYLKVLDGCWNNNPRMVLEALCSLIQNTKQSLPLSRELLQLYSLCLMYLKVDRIAEVKRIFNRLVRGWKDVPVNYVSWKNMKRDVDIEIEEAWGEKILLKTSDPIVAERLQTMKEIEPEDTREHLSIRAHTWNVTIMKQVLPSVLVQLKTPQYLDFLSSINSNQLLIDF